MGIEMGLIAWLVAIGCLCIGAAIGIWGFTDVNKYITIWFVGCPGAILLIVAVCLEFQKIADRSDEGKPIDAAIAVSRAYVSIARVIQEPRIENSQHTGWLIAVEWINRGQTPAKNFECGIGGNLFKPDVAADFDFASGISPLDQMDICSPLIFPFLLFVSF